MPVCRLPDHLVNRIAAGEVIERPAAVVKELVENALDAGSGRIEVAVEQGGRGLIRVVDDGAGMDEADLALCVERHATSKLSPDADLVRITTLGFRGEALASIGAVARVTITTRTRTAGHGSTLTVEAGRILPIRPAGTTPGTRIEVRDLFFATPARLAFLRSERAAWREVLPARRGGAVRARRAAAASSPADWYRLSGFLAIPLAMTSSKAARRGSTSDGLGTGVTM